MLKDREREVLEQRARMLEEDLQVIREQRDESELQVRRLQTLRPALERARYTIADQAALLAQLTATPFAYATVVAVEEHISDTSGLVPGAFAKLADERIVEILTPEVHGQVQVKFENGRTDTVPTIQPPDIQPYYGTFDPAEPNYEVFKKDAQIYMTRGDYNGQYGHIVVAPDQNLDLVIEFENGQRKTYNLKAQPNLEVIEVTKQHVVVLFEERTLELQTPRHKPVKAGDTVKLSLETMQIVDVATLSPVGEIGIVRRMAGDFIEVDFQGATRMAHKGTSPDKIESGDRVVLDRTGTVVLEHLGKDDERFSFTADTNVTWNQIGGLASAKQQMIEAIETPFTNADLYAYYGKKPVKGVLLYGPPGCGKTMLAKATATSLAHLHGRESSAGFLYIKGPEILDKYVGVAEATIRQIFARARKHKQEYGYPAVIFIDEADAILGKRGMGISSDIERTIVPMFLTEMDGLEDSGAVVILATNRPDVLDPAVVRDGRIDRKVKVGRPDQDSATEIFQLYLRGIPLNNGYSLSELASFGSEELFSTERMLYNIQLRNNGALGFTFGQLVNGGMVAGIVDQATSIAMNRDLASGEKNGLRKSDIAEAIDVVFFQNRDLNHSDELAEYVYDFRDDVVGVQRTPLAVTA